MTVRTNLLGGTDFVFGEAPIPSADLNDTFDETVTRLQDTVVGHNHDGVSSKLVDYDDVHRGSMILLSSGSLASSNATLFDVTNAEFANYKIIKVYVCAAASSTTNVDFRLRLNNISSASYLFYNSTLGAAYAQSSSTTSYFTIGNSWNHQDRYSLIELDFENTAGRARTYKGLSYFKSDELVVSFGVNTAITDEITRVSVYTNAGSFRAGSHYKIFGIK